MPIDRAFIFQCLQELVRIDSRNPGLEAGAPGEWELAQHISNMLVNLGWEPVLHDLGGQRANVIARRRSAGGGPSLLINVHLDTVGVKGMKKPFSADLREGRIWGRGSQDTKGGMAAVLGAVKALSDDQVRLHGDLILAFVADEEHNSIGTTDLVGKVTADAAIVIEPSDLDVCIAHRGFGAFAIRTHGRTAHGGSSDLGIDANMHMGHVLVKLDQLRRSWQAEHRHALLGSATLHIPLISGGRQLFMFADECNITVECRTIPGQTCGGVQAELRAVLARVGTRLADFRADLDLLQWRSPYEIAPDQPIVRTVRTAATQVLGRPARFISHPWWEDSALLGEAGIPTVIVGPRGGGLHTEHEWVDVASIFDLAEILHHSVLAFCGAD